MRKFFVPFSVTMPKRTRINKTNDATETQEATFPQLVELEEALQPQIDAIMFVRDVEIEQLVTELRLLRSCFNKEQLQKPLLQVFEETLPNLSIVVSDEENHNKIFDVKWKNKDGSSLFMKCAVDDGRDVIGASFLQILSTHAGRKGFLGAHNLHIKDDVLEEPSETQTLAMKEALQIPCPGASHQRLSVGMTSKTFRQPKPGEMLLSVHGSPLCVFKENNMEAINESEEG